MLTLDVECTFAEEIKKSRFIAHAAPAVSPEEALAFIARRSDPSATHNCWAYRVEQQYRSSDDGEPGGTAGRPILAAIDRAGLDRVAVLVVRHFGGIKLGAGGLSRAYGGVAASCLAKARKRPFVETVGLAIEVAFGHSNAVFALLAASSLERLVERFTPEGVVIEVVVPVDRRAALEAALREVTRGAVHVFVDTTARTR